MKGLLGIDPGLRGALAIIGDSGGLIIEPMPVVGNEIDLAALVAWLKPWKESIEIAYLEKVASMPKQGVSSTFKFGDGYGSMKGVLTALGIPFELITPQKWMKEMHVGISPDLPSKQRSKLAASRIFPEMDFRESPRCRTPHDGMVDAALIAEFCRRQRRAQS